MCSPTLRVCERNSFNESMFQLLEDALNDPAHPLHKKAVANTSFFMEIKDEPLGEMLKAEPVQLSGQPIKLDFVPLRTEPYNLKP